MPSETRHIRVLMIDDNRADYRLVEHLLAEIGSDTYQVEWIDNYQTAQQRLNRLDKHDCPYDVCLLDYQLGPDDGLELLQSAQQADCTFPIIMLTGHASHEIDMQAMRAGAMDYLSKQGLNPALLERSIRYAVERHRSAAALQQAQQATIAALESMTDAFYAVDQEWRFTYVNAQAERHLGKTRAELLGRNLWEAFPAAVDSLFSERYHWAMTHQQPVAFEAFSPTVQRWVEVRAAPSPTGLAIHFLDITEHKQNHLALRQVAQQLQQQEALLRQLVQNFPNGTINIFDHQLRYTFVAGKGLEEVGLTPEMLTGKTLAECFPPEPVAYVEPYYRRALAGETLSFDFHFAQRYYHMVAAPLHDAPAGDEASDEVGDPPGEGKSNDGAVQHIIVIAQDVTERQRIEQALQEEQQRFAHIFEHSPVPIAVTTLAEGRFVDANPAFAELFGYSRAELMSRTTLELNIWQDITQRERILRELREQETVGDLEVGINTQHGARYVLATMRLVEFESQPCVLVFAQDITHRKHAEDQIRISHEQVQRSNQALQEFTYVASHDLQEPLRKIQAFSSRLRDKYGDVLDEGGRDYLARIENAGSRMQGLIRDLLDLARVDTAARRFTPVELGQVMREVMADLEVRLQETGAQVQVGQLPTLEADAAQMRQLLQNLLSNALKFHHPGTVPVVAVQATLEQDGTACCLSIRDNGIGFDPQQTQRIFEPFQRLHGRDQYAGSGIGLATCQRIVQRHGGHISTHSQPGQGATFLVTLPVSQTDNSHQPTP